MADDLMLYSDFSVQDFRQKRNYTEYDDPKVLASYDDPKVLLSPKMKTQAILISEALKKRYRQ
jgi:hypothetical protein